MKWYYYFLIVSLAFSCHEDEELKPLFTPKLMEIPKGFPDIEFPEGNEFTEVRWKLGKRLFFDPIMSSDKTISCASCHQPKLAFSDDISSSLGVGDRKGTRNSPSIANVVYQPYLTREGGVPTLEMQVFVPIQEHNEFDFNIVLLSDRLNQDSSYIAMAKEAYDRLPDAFVITRAIACFERSLLSGYSDYDQYINYQLSTALDDNEIRGMELFFSSRTNCSTCHSDFNFTNYAFENNGLYDNYEDEGRYRLTKLESDRALFKVPSLRNVELTGPYMHDGSMNSLEEVIDHYQSGGKNHPHKNAIIKPLQLSDSEKGDLINFLKSLTDNTFVNNPLFSN